MTDRLREACPACESRSLSGTELCDQTFSVCETCGCVFANPLPEEIWDSDSSGFYLRDEPTLETAMGEVEKWRVRIREIERFISQGSLLDVGCGLGYVVKAAEKEGWQAAGCDLSEACCEFGRRVLGVQLFSGGYEELPALSGIRTPDVITLNHVLEHLATPSEFVRFAEATLAPGGLAVVEIPNLFSFESLFNAESWYGLAIPHHVSFFTPESLNRLFGPNFRVKLLEYSVAQFFHDNVAGYLHRLTRDQGLIDRYARQFSGTAMVAYIEKQSGLPLEATPDRNSHSLVRRAVGRIGRVLRQG